MNVKGGWSLGEMNGTGRREEREEWVNSAKVHFIYQMKTA
jgi:hypothetical protein